MAAVAMRDQAVVDPRPLYVRSFNRGLFVCHDRDPNPPGIDTSVKPVVYEKPPFGPGVIDHIWAKLAYGGEARHRLLRSSGPREDAVHHA